MLGRFGVSSSQFDEFPLEFAEFDESSLDFVEFVIEFGATCARQHVGEVESSVEKEQNDEERGAVRDRSEEGGVERGPSAIPDDPEYPEQHLAGRTAFDSGDVRAGRDRVPLSAHRQGHVVQSGVWVCLVAELLQCVEIVQCGGGMGRLVM